MIRYDVIDDGLTLEDADRLMRWRMTRPYWDGYDFRVTKSDFHPGKFQVEAAKRQVASGSADRLPT